MPEPEDFEPERFHQEEPDREQRFQVYSRGIKVAASDHECFLNVYVDGALVYALDARVEYEDPATKKFGERPLPVGFKVRAKAADDLKGNGLKPLPSRRWVLRKDIEDDEETPE